jgi:hypothetical protein
MEHENSFDLLLNFSFTSPSKNKTAKRKKNLLLGSTTTMKFSAFLLFPFIITVEFPIHKWCIGENLLFSRFSHSKGNALISLEILSASPTLFNIFPFFGMLTVASRQHQWNISVIDPLKKSKDCSKANNFSHFPFKCGMFHGLSFSSNVWKRHKHSIQSQKWGRQHTQNCGKKKHSKCSAAVDLNN